ncbi:uncharacterized protein LOC128345447 [Hemicordylus capensis]|uniref:uncharacterized protein LOC128345447 n=1 Tax=Hemicordylus capensis TaxID=884348 RepID=UPI002304C765|nr:uncharacterized protein LOC128345447 [Hemicordylus capensis]
MEDITAHPDPGSFFRKTLDTVTELSKIKPPLPEELRSAVLHVAVSGANYLEPGTHNETFQSLQRMIRGFLEEAPSVHNLTSILTELQRYSTAKDPQLQALAQEACSCLLQHAASLPAFHVSPPLWTWLGSSSESSGTPARCQLQKKTSYWSLVTLGLPGSTPAAEGLFPLGLTQCPLGQQQWQEEQQRAGFPLGLFWLPSAPKSHAPSLVILSFAPNWIIFLILIDMEKEVHILNK